MKPLYQHHEGQPFHISVGAVLVNDEAKICVHKNTTDSMPTKWHHILGGLTETYVLMRETVEGGETLEEAVRRGLKEEFGAEAKVTKYLGSIQAMIVNKDSTEWEKTTLYFAAQLTHLGERSATDDDSHSTLEWIEPKVLIEKMAAQGMNTVRQDLNESKIIKAYLEYGI
jgi:ADP-ribose pyrophosphatase YjhB (NUDIX family)